MSTSKITIDYHPASSPEPDTGRWVPRALGSESQGGDLQDGAR
jgi:hypothetical protein